MRVASYTKKDLKIEFSGSKNPLCDIWHKSYMTIYESYTSLLPGLSFVHNIFTRNAWDATFLRAETRWDVLTRRAKIGRSCSLLTIYARVRNTEDKIGFVSLQNLGTGLLFGNFVAENKDCKAYALCYNTGDESVALSPPLIELEPCEIRRKKDNIFDEDINNGFEANELERANVLRVFTDKDNDRTARILQELNPDTLKGLNEEEIEHIRNLINERPQLFGLPGEKKKLYFNNSYICYRYLQLNITYTRLIKVCYAWEWQAAPREGNVFYLGDVIFRMWPRLSDWSHGGR